MFALTVLDGMIYVRNKQTGQDGVFNSDGSKARGDLDLPPDEVRFMAWCQQQSPKLTDKQLRDKWANLKRG